jgi:hypothetical protein
LRNESQRCLQPAFILHTRLHKQASMILACFELHIHTEPLNGEVIRTCHPNLASQSASAISGSGRGFPNNCRSCSRKHGPLALVVHGCSHILRQRVWRSCQSSWCPSLVDLSTVGYRDLDNLVAITGMIICKVTHEQVGPPPHISPDSCTCNLSRMRPRGPGKVTSQPARMDAFIAASGCCH